MKDLGYGKGYRYDHDAPEGFSGQDYFPDEMERREFYKPRGEGTRRGSRSGWSAGRRCGKGG
jgi:replication-associated recombination protein RarA